MYFFWYWLYSRKDDQDMIVYFYNISQYDSYLVDQSIYELHYYR